jgi:hypothetical protein
MVTVKNIEGKPLELSFEGKTYTFPKNQIVYVDDEVVAYLKDLWPLAFEFNVAVPKGTTAAKVQFTKTRSLIPIQEEVADMKPMATGRQIGTFGSESDLKGEGFYGPGLEQDDLSE